MIFPAGNVFITIRGFLEKKEWVEPIKFARGVIIQIGISMVASILTVIFFGYTNFTENLFLEFLILFPIFSILFTVVFFTIYGLYSFFNE
jgi:hypothetical protein